MKAATLRGRRVLITRESSDAEPWAARFAALGAEPVVLPCIAVEFMESEQSRAALIAACEGASWLLLLSAHAAEGVRRLLGRAALPAISVGAVGDTTAAAARRHLGRVDFVAETQNAVGAVRALMARIPADESARAVVIAAALDGRRDADELLAENGCDVRRVAVYRTVEAPPEHTKRRLDGVDYVLLASPSAARGLVNRVAQPVRARVVTIGPTTSAAARAAGLTVFAEAARPSLDGLLEAMC